MSDNSHDKHDTHAAPTGATAPHAPEPLKEGGKKQTINKLVDIGLPFLLDLVAFIGAPMAIRYLTGREPKPEAVLRLKEITELHEKGEAAEATSKFRTFVENYLSSFTMADQQEFAQDGLRAVRAKLLTEEEFGNFLKRVAALEPRLRTNLRKAHSTQPDQDLRSMNFAQLAKLDDTVFKAYIEGNGIADKRTLDHLADAAERRGKVLDKADRILWKKIRTSPPQSENRFIRFFQNNFSIKFFD